MLSNLRTCRCTYSLFFLPRFHGGLVFLELVAPVRVHPMVVLLLGGRRAPVRVHRQVKCAQEGAGQLTVVPATVLFGRADDHHAAFHGGYVLVHSAENENLPLKKKPNKRNSTALKSLNAKCTKCSLSYLN